MKLIASLFMLFVCSLSLANGGVININDIELQNLEENNQPILSIEEIMKLVNVDNLESLQQNEKEIKETMDMELRDLHPDIQFDLKAKTPELIKRRGYPVETHSFENDDGYTIEMHRIPGSSSSPPRPGKIPVLLMHGILDTSATWVLMGPQQSLGYLLADSGYDVWMGNARGNRYSRKHKTNDPDGWRGNRRAFWDFSWHNIGMVDVPNMIEYITSKTSQRRMHYIGHSQGTTAFFVMASQRKEYNDRIISMQALAPITFMSNLKNPFLRASVLLLDTLEQVTSILGIYEFLPNTNIMQVLGQAACNDESATQAICTNVLFLIGGFNSKQMNSTMIPVIMGHTPAGSSTDQIIHYGQLIKSGHFRQYDHGLLTNIARYGSITPPKYNLKNVKSPVALHYSNNDWMSDGKDVAKLEKELPKLIGKFLVPDSRFTHFDYVWGIDARNQVYNRVLALMKAYE